MPLPFGNCRPKTLEVGQNIGFSVCGSVQDGIVGGVGQDERPHDRRLNHVGHVRQVPREACRFARRDTIARLQSRIQDDTFDFVKNEPRQNYSVGAADDVRQTKCRTLRAYQRSNQKVWNRA